VYVYVCVCVCVRVCVRVRVHACVCVCTRAHVNVTACDYAHMCACVWLLTYLDELQPANTSPCCVGKCMCVYACVCVLLFMRVCARCMVSEY